ncbi:MAG: GNAT family N-acetyltransferase [Spirochaetales bacterium]|nr:GNAT family N-acetyltransferase [Spirochaetales bacterium]
MEDCTIVHTDGKSEDFIELCRQLDGHLEEALGVSNQRGFYNSHNGLEDIKDAVVIYLKGEPVAGGSFKIYREGIAEIKRVFVKGEHRRKGLASLLMGELEGKAREAGFTTLYLETGVRLAASKPLYQSLGFTVRENYGPYRGKEESLCMEKSLIGEG